MHTEFLWGTSRRRPVKIWRKSWEAKIAIDVRDIGFVEDRGMQFGQDRVEWRAFDIRDVLCYYGVVSLSDSLWIIFMPLKVVH
jgi:hypothetical protein